MCNRIKILQYMDKTKGRKGELAMIIKSRCQRIFTIEMWYIYIYIINQLYTYNQELYKNNHLQPILNVCMNEHRGKPKFWNVV